MRRTIRLILALAVTFAAGAAFGYWAQRQHQLARLRSAEAFARDLTGLNDPVPPAPAWDEWRYPGARILGHQEGLALRLSGQLVRPSGHYALFATADSLERVARHYARRGGFEDPEAAATSRSAIYAHGTLQGTAVILLDDNTTGYEPGKPRPLRMKCLLHRSPSYDLTVVLTRGETEDQTHILLAYDPKAPRSGELTR